MNDELGERIKKNIIRGKSFYFALRIVNLYKYLQTNKKFVLSKQILRSGTQWFVNLNTQKAGLILFINKENYNSLNDKLIEIQKLLSAIITT